MLTCSGVYELMVWAKWKGKKRKFKRKPEPLWSWLCRTLIGCETLKDMVDVKLKSALILLLGILLTVT